MKKWMLCIGLVVCLTACATPVPEVAVATPAPTPVMTPTPTVPVVDLSEARLLGVDGGTQYFSMREDTDCVLYVDDGTDVKRLAVFPQEGDTFFGIKNIYCFGVCGEWLVMSVGFFAGSGGFFHGDIFYLNRDGGEVKAMEIGEVAQFFIVDDWVYYTFVANSDERPHVDGCYRIRPDGSDKQFLSDVMDCFMEYDAADGYFYGMVEVQQWAGDYQLNRVRDLVRCKPDGSDKTVLFRGADLPVPDFGNPDCMKYFCITIGADDLVFSAAFHGNIPGDGSHGRDIYIAKYRVNKDGSELTLIEEEYSRRELVAQARAHRYENGFELDYPSIDGYPTDINNMIQEDAMAWFETFFPDKGEMVLDAWYEVVYLAQDWISIQYNASVFYHGAARPLHDVHIINIDIASSRQMCLSDYVVIDQKFADAFFAAAREQYQESQGEEWSVLHGDIEAFFESMHRFVSADDVQLFSQVDREGSWMSSYRIENGVALYFISSTPVAAVSIELTWDEIRRRD